MRVSQLTRRMPNRSRRSHAPARQQVNEHDLHGGTQRLRILWLIHQTSFVRVSQEIFNLPQRGIILFEHGQMSIQALNSLKGRRVGIKERCAHVWPLGSLSGEHKSRK